MISWAEFLRYCSNPTAIPIIVGVLLSWILEYVPSFENLEPRYKRLVVLGLSMVVPLSAAGLGVLTAGWPGTWDLTWWPAIVAGALAFGSGTVAHARKLAG